MVKGWVTKIVSLLLVLATAQPAWAFLCWRDDRGGLLSLELGPTFNQWIPLMGSYSPPPGDPVCPGGTLWPVQGVARLFPLSAQVGLTIYTENGQACGTRIMELTFDLITLEARGFMRAAPNFDMPTAVTFTPSSPPNCAF